MSFENLTEDLKAYIKQIALFKGYDFAIEFSKYLSTSLRAFYFGQALVVFSSISFAVSLYSLSFYLFLQNIAWLYIAGFSALIFLASFWMFKRKSSYKEVMDKTGIEKAFTSLQQHMLQKKRRSETNHHLSDVDKKVERLEKILQAQNKALEGIISNMESSYSNRHDNGRSKEQRPGLGPSAG